MTERDAKKWLFIGSLGTVGAFIYCRTRRKEAVPPTPPIPPPGGGGMIVALDPGHGGHDPGAVGPTGLQEKAVNLALAKLVAARISPHSGILTRDDDVYLSLRARAEKANTARAHAFVSVHCNASVNPVARGTEVYFYPGSVQGRRLATAVYDSLLTSVGLTGRGVKEQRFTVLAYTRMPACLVETAFISNPEEESLLRSAEFLGRAADGIANGIRRFFGT